MSKDLQHIKQFDEYLSGELSAESQREFEQKLREDIDLLEEVSIIKQVIQGIKGYAFKAMVRDIHEEHFGKKNPSQEE